MNYLLLNCILIVLNISCLTKGVKSQKPVEVSISILSGTTTNTTAEANFKCHPIRGITIKEITGKFNLNQSFIPCTGIKSLVQTYAFNISTFGGKRQTLVVKDLKTVSLHVEGEQIATQRGPIEGTVCSPGRVVLTHWFRSEEPLSCSSMKGLTRIESPTSTFRITGDKCEVFCTGSFKVEYTPGLKNSRLPGVASQHNPLSLTLRPFQPKNSSQIG